MTGASPPAASPGRGLAAGLAAAAFAAATGAAFAVSNPKAALLANPGGHGSAGCLDCHVPFSGAPSSRCLGPGCHGELATGTPPLDGPALPIRHHVVIRKLSCGTCHTLHGPDRASRAAPHSGLPADRFDAACARCHIAPPGHAAGPCQDCHGPVRWSQGPPK